MKKALLFLFSITIIFSCKKDEESNNPKDKFTGTWEYESFIGYDYSNTLAPGNGKIMVLSADGNFERRRHDTIEFKGTYTLQVEKDCCDRKNNLTLSTSEYSSNNFQYISIENGKLKLSTPCCYQDGGIASYRRIE